MTKRAIELDGPKEDYSTDACEFNDPAAYSLWADEGRRIVSVEEGARWMTGDWLLKGLDLFPDLTMADHADALKIAPTTAYERALMSAYYDAPARAEWESKGLAYSHMREARKLGAYEEVRPFLQACVDNVWTVRDVMFEVKRRLGQTIAPMPVFSGSLTFRVVNGAVMVDGLDGVQMQAGVRYHVVIKAAQP